jgi:hypothetical protein
MRKLDYLETVVIKKLNVIQKSIIKVRVFQKRGLKREHYK